MTANPTNQRAPEAYVSEKLFESGIGYVVVCRFKNGGTMVEAGVFLVDVFCLGVKNAFFTRLSADEYEERLLKRVFNNDPGKPMEPGCARKLVEGAVAYAGRLGLAPHVDYKQGCRVFGGIDASLCGMTFTYGQNGQPFYCQGPHESEEQVDHIMRQLELRCGQGNYHFMLGGPINPD